MFSIPFTLEVNLRDSNLLEMGYSVVRWSNFITIKITKLKGLSQYSARRTQLGTRKFNFFIRIKQFIWRIWRIRKTPVLSHQISPLHSGVNIANYRGILGGLGVRPRAWRWQKLTGEARTGSLSKILLSKSTTKTSAVNRSDILCSELGLFQSISEQPIFCQPSTTQSELLCKRVQHRKIYTDKTKTSWHYLGLSFIWPTFETHADKEWISSSPFNSCCPCWICR